MTLISRNAIKKGLILPEEQQQTSTGHFHTVRIVEQEKVAQPPKKTKKKKNKFSNMQNACED